VGNRAIISFARWAISKDEAARVPLPLWGWGTTHPTVTHAHHRDILGLSSRSDFDRVPTGGAADQTKNTVTVPDVGLNAP